MTVHYEMFGSGRPLLMLHAGYHDHRHVQNDMEPLFEQRLGWKRIYPDLPGHGKTLAPQWLSNHDQVLDVILKFIDAIIPNQCFAVGGVSRGGYLARGIAYSIPESVDGLLLVVPAAGAVSKSPLPEHVVMVKDMSIGTELNLKETKFLNERVVVQTQEVLNRLRTEVFPAFKLVDKKFQTRIMDNYDFSFTVDQMPEPFNKPTLILMGRQDSDVGYRDAWKLMEYFPHASFAILDRAGHFLSSEQKKLFRALVNEWLDRVEEVIS